MNSRDRLWVIFASVPHHTSPAYFRRDHRYLLADLDVNNNRDRIWVLLQAGDAVLYAVGDGTKKAATVAKVHTDDSEAYYTIKVDGVERGTVRARLTAARDGGSSGVCHHHHPPIRRDCAEIILMR